MKDDHVIESCKRAAIKMLESRGYNVLSCERHWTPLTTIFVDFIIAIEKNTIAFAAFEVSEDDKHFPELKLEQRLYEGFVASWLSEHSISTSYNKIRFDHISAIMIEPDQAFLRHHINVFN